MTSAHDLFGQPVPAPPEPSAREQSRQALTSSSSNEWYTPADVIEDTRMVLGGVIDLDPASCLAANMVVQAQRFYTVDQDGLGQSWNASSVFCNPPYGWRVKGVLSNQDAWSQRMIEQYQAGAFRAGLFLCNSSTGDQWFRRLWHYPICFPGQRLRFWSVEQGNQPIKSNAIVYFGQDLPLFVRQFRKYGPIWPGLGVVDSLLQGVQCE